MDSVMMIDLMRMSCVDFQGLDRLYLQRSLCEREKAV